MTDLDFGPLVLGGNTFGWTSDRDESFAVLDAFADAGGRSIDTADSYSHWVPGHSGGESETILGEWFSARRRRDDVEVATKVFALPARPGLSPANIRAAVDDSLRRLQTDRIDLYFAHRDDDSVAQEEYVSAFAQLIADGKIREAGASNFGADRLRTAVGIARDQGVPGFTVAQDAYNLVDRGIEDALLPTLRDLGVLEVPYSGLASGFLTGKYRAGENVDSPRAEGAAKRLEDPEQVAVLERLESVAAERDASMSAVALAWVRQQPGIGAPIASARTTEQLPQLVESFTLSLTDEELARLAG